MALNTNRSASQATLADWRMAAAEASGGDSSAVIHGTFERTIRRLGLDGDVLDFGAGKGLLARRLLQMSCFSSVSAADLVPRPENLEEQIKWISCDLNGRADLPDGSFDAVVAAEVIEHLENPRAMVRECFRLLRPGGTLLLSTPNNESWRSILALLFQGHYALFGTASYPAHITALLRKDLERCLAEARFSRPSFVFTNEGVIPKTKGLRWQTVTLGLAKGLRFSDNVLVVANRPA